MGPRVVKAGDRLWDNFFRSVSVKTIEATANMAGHSGLSVELRDAPGRVRAFVDPWDEASAAWVREYVGERLPMGVALEVHPSEMMAVLEVHDS